MESIKACGYVRLYGKKAKRYLAMNSRGVLYTTVSFSFYMINELNESELELLEHNIVLIDLIQFCKNVLFVFDTEASQQGYYVFTCKED